LQNSMELLLKLLDHQGPSLHALLTRLTFSEDVAEDLMQDLFIKLSGSKRLDKVDNLAAYARTCAMNLAFDWRRKQARTHTCSDEFIDPASDDKSSLSHLIENEQIKRILEAADRLNTLNRQVFVLRYIEQRSFEQIARDVKKTPHHVRALASRSLTRVRELCAKVPIPGPGGQA
jgi:RNA polymerase sigma-70 factor, ECF subfamily